MEKKKAHQTNNHTELLTRSEVAQMFKISLVTVWQWTQKGILKAHRFGTRIYFKRSEIEANLIAVTPKKRGANG